MKKAKKFIGIFLIVVMFFAYKHYQSKVFKKSEVFKIEERAKSTAKIEYIKGQLWKSLASSLKIKPEEKDSVKRDFISVLEEVDAIYSYDQVGTTTFTRSAAFYFWADYGKVEVYLGRSLDSLYLEYREAKNNFNKLNSIKK